MIQMFSGIDSTSSALEAERVRMQVISQNIANADSATGPDGKPYQRRDVLFETILRQNQQGENVPMVEVGQIRADPRPPRLIFNPDSAQADAEGMVAVPDINIHEEMADLISSSRAFEANLAVVKNARSMALQTLAIGKH